MTLGFHSISGAPISDDGQEAAPPVPGPPWLAVVQTVVAPIHVGAGYGTHYDRALFHSGLDKVKVAGFAWQTRTRTAVVGQIVSVPSTARFHRLIAPPPPVPGPPWLAELRPTVGELVSFPGFVVRQRLPGPTPPLPIPPLLEVRFFAGPVEQFVGSARWSRTHLIDYARRSTAGRGQYRIANAAVFRFYRTLDSAPPAEGDVAYATSAGLPSTPADLFADGVWRISMSFFNGFVDSGFLPLGPNGETFIRLDLSGGADIGNPPDAPLAVRLVPAAGGTSRLTAVYAQFGSGRADTWAIAHTDNGVDPPEDAPDIEIAMDSTSVAVLDTIIPAAADGATVKVRLQSKRSGAPDVFSDDSGVHQITADAVGPTAPDALESWTGQLPGEG